eukprot:1142957-Pelagomonas_calceolata.AAC.9
MEYVDGSCCSADGRGTGRGAVASAACCQEGLPWDDEMEEGCSEGGPSRMGSSRSLGCRSSCKAEGRGTGRGGAGGPEGELVGKSRELGGRTFVGLLYGEAWEPAEIMQKLTLLS